MALLNKNKGFTLIEVLTTIMIISALAGVSIPRLTMHLERMRSAEGIQVIESLYKAQQVYFYENNAYTSTLGDLDIDIPPSSYFNTPTVATTDPIASLARNTGSYTLQVDATGTISCTPSGSTCTKLGF